MRKSIEGCAWNGTIRRAARVLHNTAPEWVKACTECEMVRLDILGLGHWDREQNCAIYPFEHQSYLPQSTLMNLPIWTSVIFTFSLPIWIYPYEHQSFLPQSDIQSINNFCDTGFDGWFRPSLIMAVMVLTKTLAGRFARGVLHCCQRIEEAVAIIVLFSCHHGPDLYVSLDLLQYWADPGSCSPSGYVVIFQLLQQIM